MKRFIIFLIAIINTVLCVCQCILTESNLYIFIIVPCFGLLIALLYFNSDIALLYFNSDIEHRYKYPQRYDPYTYNFKKVYKNIITREK